MAGNHTRGPWAVVSGTRIEAPNFGLVASLRGDTMDPATHANAALIAEAPAMLEALRAFVHQRDFFAEHGEYDLHTYHPDENQQFDDWAADIAATILARIDGAAPSGEAVAPTARPAGEPVRVLLHIEGGCLQWIGADAPNVQALVIDYDTEGADKDRLRDIPQDDGTTAEAFTGWHTPDSDVRSREFIARAWAAAESEPEPSDCPECAAATETRAFPCDVCGHSDEYGEA